MFNICIRLEQGVVKWRKMWWRWLTLIPEPPRLDHWSSGTGKVCMVLVLLPGSRIGLRSWASRFTVNHGESRVYFLNETWWNRYTMSNMYMSHSTSNNTRICIYTHNIITYILLHIQKHIGTNSKASKPTECDSNLLQTTFPPMVPSEASSSKIIAVVRDPSTGWFWSPDGEASDGEVLGMVRWDGLI